MNAATNEVAAWKEKTLQQNLKLSRDTRLSHLGYVPLVGHRSLHKWSDHSASDPTSSCCMATLPARWWLFKKSSNQGNIICSQALTIKAALFPCSHSVSSCIFAIIGKYIQIHDEIVAQPSTFLHFIFWPLIFWMNVW